MMKKIPSKLRNRILDMPEYSQGVARVCITLRDGTKISPVYVAGGKEIVKVGDNDPVTFDPKEIIAVEVVL
jgi:hypothetical protein